MKNYYEILEVSEKASKEVINKAHKALVAKYHPDSFSGDAKKLVEDRLKEINEAYSVLSDEFLRSQYDKERNSQNIKNVEMQNNIDNKEETKEKKEGTISKFKAKRMAKKQAKPKIGTAGALVDLTKEVFSNIPKFEKKKPTKKGVLALIAAIAIVAIVILILWCIPFTHDFIKSFLLLEI